MTIRRIPVLSSFSALPRVRYRDLVNIFKKPSWRLNRVGFIFFLLLLLHWFPLCVTVRIYRVHYTLFRFLHSLYAHATSVAKTALDDGP